MPVEKVTQIKVFVVFAVRIDHMFSDLDELKNKAKKDTNFLFWVVLIVQSRILLKVPCRKEFEAQSTMGSKRQLKYPCSRSLCTGGQKYKL
jgi:hypothetical protein